MRAGGATTWLPSVWTCAVLAWTWRSRTQHVTSRDEATAIPSQNSSRSMIARQQTPPQPSHVAHAGSWYEVASMQLTVSHYHHHRHRHHHVRQGLVEGATGHACDGRELMETWRHHLGHVHWQTRPCRHAWTVMRQWRRLLRWMHLLRRAGPPPAIRRRCRRRGRTGGSRWPHCLALHRCTGAGRTRTPHHITSVSPCACTCTQCTSPAPHTLPPTYQVCMKQRISNFGVLVEHHGDVVPVIHVHTQPQHSPFQPCLTKGVVRKREPDIHLDQLVPVLLVSSLEFRNQSRKRLVRSAHMHRTTQHTNICIPQSSHSIPTCCCWGVQRRTGYVKSLCIKVFLRDMPKAPHLPCVRRRGVQRPKPANKQRGQLPRTKGNTS